MTDLQTAVRIDRPGLLATVQDLGRPGFASRGIARSGALDRAALRLANRLVGNAEGEAALELTMGGFAATLSAESQDLWIAITGAWGEVAIDGHPADPYRAMRWPSGTVLEIAPPVHGVRSYLAIRGGIDAPEVAGSRASDLMAGLGHPPLVGGDLLGVRGVVAGPVPVHDFSPWGAPGDDLEIRVAPGPRADWFEASALEQFFREPWFVTNESNRVGMRLDGTPLTRLRDGELPSEGMMPGAIQMPPSGLPTVLLADGPVTGGYPVIAVVTEASLDVLAQARPGQRVHFRHARP